MDHLLHLPGGGLEMNTIHPMYRAAELDEVVEERFDFLTGETQAFTVRQLLAEEIERYQKFTGLDPSWPKWKIERLNRELGYR